MPIDRLSTQTDILLHKNDRLNANRLSTKTDILLHKNDRLNANRLSTQIFY